MDLFEAIETRRSVRRYTAEPVSAAQTERLIRAAMQAPSAHNRRPWRFITVTDGETRTAMIPFSPWWKLLADAPLAVVVCVSATEDGSQELEVDGAAAAMENMLLAANAMGLGAVWLGMCEANENHAALKALLGIPEGFNVAGVMSVGHPAESPAKVDRFEPEKWFSERWGSEAKK